MLATGNGKNGRTGEFRRNRGGNMDESGRVETTTMVLPGEVAHVRGRHVCAKEGSWKEEGRS